MSIFNGAGRVGNRRPSLKGKVQFYMRRGGEVAAAWPKKRGQNVPQATKDRMDWFSQAQLAAKYLPARQMSEIMKAVEGTPLLPRDITTMLFAGRCFMFVTSEGRRVYSMAMVIDVSESLDVIGQAPGTILFRAAQLWQPLAPTVDGYTLTLANGQPVWAPGSGGADGAFVDLATYDGEVDGAIDALVTPKIIGRSRIEIICTDVTLAASGWRVVQFSTDDGATWWEAQSNYRALSGNGSYGATDAAVFMHGTASALARTCTAEVLSTVAKGKKITLAPQRSTTVLMATEAPITNIRVIGWLSVGDYTQITGGKITIAGA